jgi:DNA (cytosine-5)-methyltransferase 1
MPSFFSSPHSVWDVIGDLPPLYPLIDPQKNHGKCFSHSFSSKCEAINHLPRFHSQRDIEIFRVLSKDIESGECKYTSVEELIKLYQARTSGKSTVHKYYVLRRNEQSNTIPAHLYKDGLRHIHPDSEQARSITVREAARLQTFPDDYIFTGSMMSQYKMIGNAVPPKFANILANALIKIIKEYGI